MSRIVVWKDPRPRSAIDAARAYFALPERDRNIPVQAFVAARLGSEWLDSAEARAAFPSFRAFVVAKLDAAIAGDTVAGSVGSQVH